MLAAPPTRISRWRKLCRTRRVAASKHSRSASRSGAAMGRLDLGMLPEGTREVQGL